MSNRSKKLVKQAIYHEDQERAHRYALDKDIENIFFVLRQMPNSGRTAQAGDYTALISDFIIGITDTSSARTVTLPPAANMTPGVTIIVKDESGAAGTNNITVDGNGSETIDGATTQTISTNYGVLRIYSNGTAWFTA